jgi:hypothetical protein
VLIYSNKLTRSDLDAIAERMPITLFDTDPEFSGDRRRRIKVSLRPVHGEAGERWRKVRDQFTGRSRRIFACSWDAHYVFFAALLALDPNAEIKSMLAHWKGREDFHDRAPATGDTNWGSMYMPQYASEMCHESLSIGELRTLGNEIAGEIDPDLPLQPSASDHGSTTHIMQQSMMRACPHFIMVPCHYRQNGTCRCNDFAHSEMAEWGYHWDGGRWITPLYDETGV